RAGGECMAELEVRIGVVYGRIRNRARRIEVAGRRVRRGDVDRVREGVRRQALQASGKTLLELELESMVVGGRRSVGYGNRLKVRIHIKELGLPKQVAPNRADVC